MFRLRFDSIYSKWTRYDLKFLLQFREICVDKPDDLPPLETFHLTPQIRPYSRLPSERPAIPSGSSTSPSPNPIQHVEKGKGKAKSRKKLPVPTPTVPSETIQSIVTLVNTLTVDNFDACSDEIINYLNPPESPIEGDTMKHIALSIVERAISSEVYPAICARLYDKVMQNIDASKTSDVQNAQNKPMGGDQLLRRYVMEECKQRWQRRNKGKSSSSSSPPTGDRDRVDERVGEITPSPGDVGNSEWDTPSRRTQILLATFVGELYKVHRITRESSVA